MDSDTPECVVVWDKKCVGQAVFVTFPQVKGCPTTRWDTVGQWDKGVSWDKIQPSISRSK